MDDDVIPDNLFLPQENTKDEIIAQDKEALPLKEKKRHSALKRTKSQWDDFVTNVDMTKSMNSSVFKLTLRQVKGILFD